MKICGVYILTFPNGKKYVRQSVDIFETYSLKEFGNQYNIDGSGLYKVVKNKLTSIRGWTVKYKET